MSYQERINNIEKRREKGRKGIPIFGGYSCLYIVSALYEHNISFPKNSDYQRIDDKSVYDAKYRDFLDDDFYVIIRALDNSNIEEMITKIPRNIPILIEDGTKIYDNPNVLYNFKYFMDIDFLYKLIQEDKLYFNCNKEYFPVIVISDFNRDSIHKLEFVEKYLEKYSNVTYSLNIEINSLEALQLLGDFLKDYKNIKIKLNLADDLFFEEEINKNSARSIIRNYDDYSHLLINYILRKDIYYNYLDMNFKSLANVVAFEKMLDVLLARIPREAADLDKITFVVMFIANYFGYDEYNNLRNLYEVMQDKMGVCRDFSALMKTICDRLGINCRILDGGRDIIGHAFNIVTIDGNDYFLDTTWILEELRDKSINSLEESDDYLTGNEIFRKSHQQYLGAYKEEFNCKTYSREEIKEAITRVSLWKHNYYIKRSVLKDLMRKLNKYEKIEREKDIIKAMPGGR